MRNRGRDRKVVGLGRAQRALNHALMGVQSGRDSEPDSGSVH